MKTTRTSVEIIADSTYNGTRLTTMVLTFPRIILAELNTHRVFSRNSSSSRAIPFETMLKKVVEDPFIPLQFQKDHKGMQGSELFEGLEHDQCMEDWLEARDNAVESATGFRCNVTKQLRNRILEPFLWHTAIVTSTEWDNFFNLRAHEDAEIHIQTLAYVMMTAYVQNKPKVLKEGEWHVPFGDTFDDERLNELNGVKETNKLYISTARCARVSYLNFEGKDDYDADLKLFHQLKSSGHWSPFEHCAMAKDNGNGGNFAGDWQQLRKSFHHQN